MRHTDERRIQRAVERGDDDELRNAVTEANKHGLGLRYDEVESIVARTPGGWQYTRLNEIRMGNTSIRNRFGRIRID